MRFSETRREKIVFVLRHLLYSSIAYYFLAVFADIVSSGAVSYFFQINLLLAVALVVAVALAWLTGEAAPKDDSASSAENRRLFFGFIIIIGLLLFIALSPHDLLVALSLSTLTVAVLYSIRNHIV